MKNINIAIGLLIIITINIFFIVKQKQTVKEGFLEEPLGELVNGWVRKTFLEEAVRMEKTIGNKITAIFLETTRTALKVIALPPASIAVICAIGIGIWYGIPLIYLFLTTPLKTFDRGIYGIL